MKKYIKPQGKKVSMEAMYALAETSIPVDPTPVNPGGSDAKKFDLPTDYNVWDTDEEEDIEE